MPDDEMPQVGVRSAGQPEDRRRPLSLAPGERLPSECGPGSAVLQRLPPGELTRIVLRGDMSGLDHDVPVE